MANFNELNDYILIHVFKFFDLSELLKITLVCKRWFFLINKNKDIWKSFIPQPKSNILHKDGTLKELLSKHPTKIKGEVWFPHPYEAFEKRNQYMKYMISICGVLLKSEGCKKSGFKLYNRLNSVYEFVVGNDEIENELLIPEEEEERDKKEKYYYPGCEFDDEGEEKYTCELINVIDFLWTKFNFEEKSSFTLTLAKKVWKYSKLVTCKEFLKVGFILESAAHRRSVKKVF